MSLRRITCLALAFALPACAADAPVDETTAPQAPAQDHTVVTVTESSPLADRIAALEPQQRPIHLYVALAEVAR